MAPLSLKIVLDEGAVTRTVKFDSSTTVGEAHAIVKEKLPTGDDGRDYGLFLTSADDALSGIWLEGFRTLEYYMLRDGDTLYYLSRRRNLRVRMLDGSVKTLQVDESKNIGALMVVICDKIGITNHDEYGLCHDEADAADEGKEANPACGTLTLKRKTQQRERDVKMDQLSKKLKTDDIVEWLDQHKTLREMSVDPGETLLLKRRLYYSDRNVDSRDPVQLNLLYVQIRNAILDGRHPVTENQAADCKVRWINIRDVNRRILRKSMSNPGQRIRMYKYENELGFMRPFYRDVLLPSGEFDSDDNNDNETQAFEEERLEEVAEDSDDASDKPIKKRKNRKSCKSPKKKKKKIFEDEEKQMITTICDESVTPSEFDPADPVDAFLMSIGATLKTFTPYHLNLAKSKIFAVVQEHDLQQIVQKQRHDAQSNDVKLFTSEAAYLQ